MNLQEKLYQFPVVNYISFEDDVQRRTLLERQMNDYGLAYNAHISTREQDENAIVNGNHLSDLSKLGKYCLLSHLRAIKKWYYNSNEAIGFFAEDDISFETVNYWNFTFNEFLTTVPQDWQCIQLAVVKKEKEKVSFQVKKRDWDDWSVTAYLIKREYAKYLIDRFYKDDTFTLFLKDTRLQPLVENIIYHEGITYTFPLFIENLKTTTTRLTRNVENLEEINAEQKFHNECSEYILNYWENQTKQMKNNLVRLALEAGGQIEPLMVPFELSKGTGQTNPSLFIENGKILVNLRGVQYVMALSEGQQRFNSPYGPLSYINPENDITLRTTNFFMKLTTDLEVERTALVDTSMLDVKPIWDFIGLEDARLVKWDDKYFLIGVRRDTTTNGEGRMEFSEIEIRQHKVKEINRSRIQPPKPAYCEKNWMPVLDMPYHFVKWTNPTEIVKVNLKEKTSETVFMGTALPTKRDIRGGSPVVTYGEYRFCITHEVDLWKNPLNQKDSQYYHRIVIWDMDWNILTISDEFKFMDGAIEFSIGLAVQDDTAYVAFGFHDNAAYILKVPVQFLLDFAMGKPTVNEGMDCNTLIEQFVDETRDSETNFNLANWYFEQKHYAGAITHYIRCAEFSEKERDPMVYESLLQISECWNQLGNRQICSKGYLNLAIAYDPTRPEAYWKLSLFHEWRQEWQECYTNACIGISNMHPLNSVYIVGFEPYMLDFQKAFSAWWVGRYNESKEMFKELDKLYNLNEKYRQLVDNNLKILGIG